jgi:hypothetical protein
MTTRIYWTLGHIRQAVREMRFRGAYWWLNKQVEFLRWRLRLRSVMTSMQSHTTAPAVPRMEFDPVHPF